jgi:hypothetical protein
LIAWCSANKTIQIISSQSPFVAFLPLFNPPSGLSLVKRLSAMNLSRLVLLTVVGLAAVASAKVARQRSVLAWMCLERCGEDVAQDLVLMKVRFSTH